MKTSFRTMQYCRNRRSNSGCHKKAQMCWQKSLEGSRILSGNERVFLYESCATGGRLQRFDLRYVVSGE